MKTIDKYSNEELDKLELDTYRGIEQAQAQLQGYQQNLMAIRAERQKREEKKKK